MTDRIAPVPDDVLRWVAGARGDGAPGYSKPPCDDTQKLARELIALRAAVRALVAEGDILAEQVSAMLEDTCGRAWLDANPLAWVALAAKAQQLLPENKEPTA